MSFLKPRLQEAYRILAPHGSFYFHNDYREVHYCKVLLDQIFGRQCFLNEIIREYDYGGRPKNRWPPKHDNIFLCERSFKVYFQRWRNQTYSIYDSWPCWATKSCKRKNSY
ncbi:MAG: DNA methyltransferase [Candidatus Dojkabacteria bacterium]|nr:DNA methyltransferase [Candidatus Dojkabacteria bacterium]